MDKEVEQQIGVSLLSSLFKINKINQSVNKMWRLGEEQASGGYWEGDSSVLFGPNKLEMVIRHPCRNVK